MLHLFRPASVLPAVFARTLFAASLSVPAGLFAAEATPAAASSSPASAESTHTASAVPVNYLLHATDLLHVEVAGDPNTAHDVRIESDGTASLAYLDEPVKLSGLTVNQAIRDIAQLYKDQSIFVKPQVSLVVVQYAEQHINIVGQVNHPGPVIIPPGQQMTLVSAITAAGGHTRIADPDVTINHKLSDGKIQTTHVNLKSAMKNASHDVPLQDGDTVYVAEDLVSW